MLDVPQFVATSRLGNKLHAQNAVLRLVHVGFEGRAHACRASHQPCAHAQGADHGVCVLDRAEVTVQRSPDQSGVAISGEPTWHHGDVACGVLCCSWMGERSASRTRSDRAAVRDTCTADRTRAPTHRRTTHFAQLIALSALHSPKNDALRTAHHDSHSWSHVAQLIALSALHSPKNDSVAFPR